MFKGLPLPKKRTRYHYPRPFNDLYCSQRAVKRTKVSIYRAMSLLTLRAFHVPLLRSSNVPFSQCPPLHLSLSVIGRREG